ncbi:MAG: hypothetical protein J6E46_10130 [Faecalicoccus sp.]|nr:hypothetical protein [Faecalicoccus sp.]
MKLKDYKDIKMQDPAFVEEYESIKLEIKKIKEGIEAQTSNHLTEDEDI